MNQRTVKRRVSLEGTGVHSGVPVKVTINPMPGDTGIIFRRIDVPRAHDYSPDIAIGPRAVIETSYCSKIGNPDGASIMTVEHLMAALAGIGVDNAMIEVDGPEMPILDGSSNPWLALIDEAGIVQQLKKKSFFTPAHEVVVRDGDSEARAKPADELIIEVTVDFPHPLVGQQFGKFRLTEAVFRKEIAPARTFVLESDVEKMRAKGLIKGGSLECAVVFGDRGVLNPEGLRFEDEPVRHKILDCLGDLAMIGKPIKGHFTFLCPGHGINNQLVRALMNEALTS